MVRAKNYETASTFVKVIRRKLLAFFPDTVYMDQQTATCNKKSQLMRNIWPFLQTWTALHLKWNGLDTRLPVKTKTKTSKLVFNGLTTETGSLRRKSANRQTRLRLTMHRTIGLTD